MQSYDGKLFKRTSVYDFSLSGTQRAIPGSQDGSVLTAPVANHIAGFASA